ncbi:MAG: hypothetical protein ABIB43_06705 [archaeon]
MKKLTMVGLGIAITVCGYVTAISIKESWENYGMVVDKPESVVVMNDLKAKYNSLEFTLMEDATNPNSQNPIMSDADRGLYQQIAPTYGQDLTSYNNQVNIQKARTPTLVLLSAIYSTLTGLLIGTLIGGVQNNKRTEEK